MAIDFEKPKQELRELARDLSTQGFSYEDVLGKCAARNVGSRLCVSKAKVIEIATEIYEEVTGCCVDERGQSCTSVGDNVPTCQNVDVGGTIMHGGQKVLTNSPSIGGQIRNYITEHVGIISNFDIDREFTLTTRNEKKARCEALRRLQKECKIKKLQGKPGSWRILNFQLDKVDFSEASKTPFSLPFPLKIGNLAQIYPGNIVMVSGTSNAGKTGFLMQTCVDTIEREKEKNQKKERESKSTRVLSKLLNKGIRYLNSEMGPDEILEWGESLGCPDIHHHVEFVNRSTDFQDALIPDGINIIDFLEVYDEFYKVGSDIAAIYDNLTTGIAIIAIQKKPGAKLGLGGQFSQHKARLAINLERTETSAKVAKLAKLKKPVDREKNCEGMECDYVISSNGGFRALTDWRYVTEKQRKAINHNYVAHGVKVPRKKEDVYQFDIMKVDGSYAKVTDETVKKWQKNMPGVNVPAKLRQIQEDSEVKPFLKKDGWFFQLANLLGAK